MNGEKQLSSDAIVAGYRAVGLCPWNVNAVHFDRLTTRPSEDQVPASSSSLDVHRPSVMLQPGHCTDGYTVVFRHDDMNNVVITHIIDSMFWPL